MALEVFPMTLREANEFVRKYHRHHKIIQGCRFCIGVGNGKKTVGAAIVGRPVSRLMNSREIAEVTRLVTDGTKNACSILYAAAARACRAIGYKTIQTYILEEEPGTSLRAAGWSFVREAGGGDWNKTRSGRRSINTGMKQLWRKEL